LTFAKYCLIWRRMCTNQYDSLQTPPLFGHPTPPLHRTHYCAQYCFPSTPCIAMYTIPMLGGWVNPHREQQTIPQGQTSIPPKIFLHANGQRPKRAMIRQRSRRRQRHVEPHTEHGLGHSGIDEMRPTKKFDIVNDNIV